MELWFISALRILSDLHDNHHPIIINHSYILSLLLISIIYYTNARKSDLKYRGIRKYKYLRLRLFPAWRCAKLSGHYMGFIIRIIVRTLFALSVIKRIRHAFISQWISKRWNIKCIAYSLYYQFKIFVLFVTFSKYSPTLRLFWLKLIKQKLYVASPLTQQ